MAEHRNHVLEGWQTVLTLAGLMVLGLVLQFLISPLSGLGIVPRSASGLTGIALSPLLHGGWGHLFANLSALVPLGFLYFWVHPRHGHRALALLWVLSGALTWLIGRSAVHIGASGLVFALFGFLLGAGFFMRNGKAIFGTIVVAAYYGPMVIGVVPTSQAISWEGHLAGLVAGFFLASQESEKADKSPPDPSPPLS